MSQVPMPIYMDYNATTPLDTRVFQAMRPYLEEQFGNAASSSHAYGWQASMAVKKAREQVSSLLGCKAAEVIWTSGATESNNMAILGILRAFRGEKPHFITQATEHKAVLEVCRAAEEWGAELTILPVEADGRINLQAFEDAIQPNTVCASIMWANNEIGTLQPIEELAKICRERKIIFHVDAAQAVGKFPINLAALNLDLLSISAHKLYGPKGVGALIVRPVNRDFDLKPVIFGGNQEKGLRPGTVNVAGVVGLGEACEIAGVEMEAESSRLRGYQRQILTRMDNASGVRLNGPREENLRLCNNLSFSFIGLTPEDMIFDLSGIAFSSGSACTSASAGASHVLTAIGLPSSVAKATLRLGFGRQTRLEEVNEVCSKLSKMLENGREQMALANAPQLEL